MAEKDKDRAAAERTELKAAAKTNKKPRAKTAYQVSPVTCLSALKQLLSGPAHCCLLVYQSWVFLLKLFVVCKSCLRAPETCQLLQQSRAYLCYIRGIDSYSVSLQLFCDKERSQLKEANPEANFGELNALLAAKWKEVSNTNKKVFQEMHEVRTPGGQSMYGYAACVLSHDIVH